MTVQLRRATADDIPRLAHWDEQPHVIAATGDDDVIDWAVELAHQDDVQEVLIAEVAGRPLGVVQIIDPANERTHYWGDIEQHLRAIDIWIGDAADLGHGHGTAMMREALERCFAPPDVTAVVIDPLASNTDAQRFYVRLGFEPVGPRTFGNDDCLVHRLERAVWASRRAR